jgi:Flp pilus assembly protein protease CpaA
VTDVWPWLLLGPAVAAALVDVRSRRIPNRLVVPALGAALLLALWQGGIVPALAGMVVGAGTGIGARVVARGGFGMGDVKLLAYGGAAVGLGGVWTLLLGTAMGGGALGLAYLARSGRAATVPYGVAIALGLALALLAG